MNCGRLIAELQRMVAGSTEVIEYPVVLVNMKPEADEDHTGVLDAVETDCFDVEQGMVVVLLSDSEEG